MSDNSVPPKRSKRLKLTLLVPEAPAAVLGTRQILTPADVAAVCAEQSVFGFEAFTVLGLNTQHRLVVGGVISFGSHQAVPLAMSAIFRPLISVGAVSFCLVHNHPGGDVEPSKEDIECTERVVASGDLLGIPCWDHVILGRGLDNKLLVFHSMRESGRVKFS